LPRPRPLIEDDARILAAGVGRNPQLASLAHDVAGRSEALELARLAYVPDFSPQFSIEGNARQTVGMMVNLPTSLVRIRGAIEESRAGLRQTQAMLRQARSERSAQFVAALVALRNHERQVALLEQVIVPKTRQLWDASSKAYSASAIGFAELADTRRMLLQARLLLAEARIAREKRLAELEGLAGVDVETLQKAPPTTQATRLIQPQRKS
jgi:outer membrane protein TolC